MQQLEFSLAMTACLAAAEIAELIVMRHEPLASAREQCKGVHERERERERER